MRAVGPALARSVSNSYFLYCGPAFSVILSVTSHATSTGAVSKLLIELCGRRRICDSVQVAGFVTSALPYVIERQAVVLRDSRSV